MRALAVLLATLSGIVLGANHEINQATICAAWLLGLASWLLGYKQGKEHADGGTGPR